MSVFSLSSLANSSYSKTAGTVRGLHFQSFPSQESKFVRCIKGKIFDVIVDIRKESKTFGKWQSIILDSKKKNMVFIPSGFAHGFQTLFPDCEILYLLTDYHQPELECGYHYNSKDLNINWISLTFAYNKKFFILYFVSKAI